MGRLHFLGKAPSGHPHRIARAKGMSQVAREADLSRESLYKTLSGERTPGFDATLKAIGAFGLTLHAEAVQAKMESPDPLLANHLLTVPGALVFSECLC